jgi:hypothetical protein
VLQAFRARPVTVVGSGTGLRADAASAGSGSSGRVATPKYLTAYSLFGLQLQVGRGLIDCELQLRALGLLFSRCNARAQSHYHDSCLLATDASRSDSMQQYIV